MTPGSFEALAEARRRTRTPAPDAAGQTHPPATAPPAMLLALQRSAGNAAVTALLQAKARPEGAAKVDVLDAAIAQARRGDPDLKVLEDGLRAAQGVGVPVDIDGADKKPPAAALAVTRTGFGPSAVAARKPAPPPKPVPAKSPLAKAVARKPAARSNGAGTGARAGGTVALASAPLAGPVDVLAAPVPPAHLPPQADPAFTAVTGQAKRFAQAKRAHPAAASKAKEAQAAAQAPANDAASQAEAAKLDTMDAQPAGSFDKVAFITAVKAAIEAKSPKNLEQADEYKESGQAGQVKSEVKGLVGGNKERSAEAIETATDAPPDASKAVAKPVAPMTAEAPGAAASIPAGGAVPKPAPPDQLNLAAGKHQADAELDAAGVPQATLATSNEPAFTGALAAKKEAAAHADAGPAQFRREEAATLAQARTGADGQTKAAVGGIQSAKAAALAQVTGSKSGTKTKDEAKRAEVAANVQSIFAATQAEVKKTLNGIDAKVDNAFDVGEKAARATFESFVEAKVSAYKRDRYGGWLGGLKWVKDKLFSVPSVVNEFFEAGRELYLKEMDRVITGVADIVAADLGAAKTRIAQGKADVAAYVKTLGPELAKVGAEAAEQVADQFGKLESDVDEKQNGLVDSLASKYVEARQGLDERIEALQAENKGFVDQAIGAIKGVVETILKLKDMLLGVLARAAAAIGKIIADPIGFLGNFVNAIKSGIVNFGTNIYDHLKKGLQQWLLGALTEGGIELPEKFDLKGIVGLVLSILGLTWERVKARIFAKLPGLQPVWDKVVGAFGVLQVLVTQGLAGLWTWVLEKAGDIKETVMAQIKDMVVVQVVKAGITWLISMLNPAGAFIKAAKMIYDIVMFFVEKAAQIKEFVDAVLDSVESIASGGVGAVASKIEQTLGKLVPILIGFLASLLGLGGISDKIKKIIETVQKPVMKVVDWVVGKAVGLGKKFIGAAKRLGGKIKAGAKKLTAKIKKKLGIKEKTPEQVAKDKQDRLDKGVAAGVAAANRFAGKPVGAKILNPVLAAIRLRYRMTSLTLVADGATWAVEGAVNPTKRGNTKANKPRLSVETPAGKALLAHKIGADGVDRIFAKAGQRSAVQGQICEELIGVKGGIGSNLEGRARKGGHATAEFIAAHRITNARQLTDGIVGLLFVGPSGPAVRVINVIESKSGTTGRGKLASESDRFSRMGDDERQELREEVIEDLLEEKYPLVLPGGRTPTPEELHRHNVTHRPLVRSKYASVITKRMGKKYRQAEPGQVRRDLERLLGGTLVIDSVPRQVINRGPSSVGVVGVLPKNTPEGGTAERVNAPIAQGGQGLNLVFERLGLTEAQIGSLVTGVLRDASKN